MLHRTGSDPGELIDLDGTLLFAADDGSNGRELWRSDGATAELVEDIQSGSASSDPEGLVVLGIRSFLLERFNLEIGAGLGPMAGKIWRIGLMGASCTERHVKLCLEALAAALEHQKAA